MGMKPRKPPEGYVKPEEAAQLLEQVAEHVRCKDIDPDCDGVLVRVDVDTRYWYPTHQPRRR